MSNRSTLIWAARIAGALSCVLAAGCTAVERGHPQPAQSATVPAPLPPAQPAPAPGEATQTPATPPPAAPAPISTPARRPPATATAASAKPAPPAKLPATVAVAPTATPPVPKPAAPTAAPKPSTPPLDLASLEARLRDTKAIGVFTKISLKNQVDDLLNKFRAYYKRQAKTTLAELRRPYDMLLLKVLSLLQDTDPPLARDIVASREAIWGILANPEKFNEAKLMAGDTP